MNVDYGLATTCQQTLSLDFALFPIYKRKLKDAQYWQLRIKQYCHLFLDLGETKLLLACLGWDPLQVFITQKLQHKIIIRKENNHSCKNPLYKRNIIQISHYRLSCRPASSPFSTYFILIAIFKVKNSMRFFTICLRYEVVKR